MLAHTDDLSPIDYEQSEKIELAGNTDIEQYSNLQYFSTRAEFKDHFCELTGWARNTNLYLEQWLRRGEKC